MKQLIFLLILATLAFACEKEPEPFNFDPNAMIILRGESVTAKGQVTGLTPLEVVENGVNIKWQSHYAGNIYYGNIQQITSTFADVQKDYEIPALKLWGTSIITQEGEYYKDLTYAFNVYITDNNNDTIAHVPDQVIMDARLLIEAAYEAENYEEVYRLFNEAFTFQPIPGN